jgi:asparagine synthase (glutamine-hydrolysing)
MSNEGRTVWLVVNGEVYNYEELRQELWASGHKFSSQTDSEVIVHGYEEWGQGFLKHLNGMFALALWDTRTQTLLLARDPIGEKPLYYHWSASNPKRLVFASEIKAILKYGVAPCADESSLSQYLALQYVPGNRTMFEDIRKVLPGQMVVFADGVVSQRKYWDIKPGTAPCAGAQELRHLLESSTELRMRSDVPVGAFLSGGIDSSAIVALARKFNTGVFHTFSVGFESFSETPYAETVSQHLGTTHHNLMVKADDVARDLGKIAWHYDEPVGDAAIINNYYLGEAAREYVKVVLAGEGGDELFGGYRHYQIGLMWHWMYRMPSTTRRLVRFLLPFYPGRVDDLEGRLHHLASFFCQPTFADAHQYLMSVLSADEIRYYSLLNLDYLDLTPHEKMSNALDDMLATDCKNLLPEKFLMKADKAVMASGIEERLPLLDTRIVDLAFSLPPAMKIRDGVEKWVFREAVKDLLPPEIAKRKKQVFNTPVRLWLRNNRLAEMAADRIENGELIKEYFRTERLKPLVKKLRKRMVGGNGGIWERAEVNFVWTLFTLQLWHDVYFRGKQS